MAVFSKAFAALKGVLLVAFNFEEFASSEATVPGAKPTLEERWPHDIAAAPVAIGEIGLDYHYEGYNRSAQIRLFEQMLELAIKLKLPVSSIFVKLLMMLLVFF